MSALYVTGTDTGVGKTVATAALAVCLGFRVYKPVQAGLPADIDFVTSVVDVDASEGIRLRDPMAPVAAAAREGVELPPLAVHQARIAELGDVLVEGAGGLLVRLSASETMADFPGPFVVVCRAALGTLNHTALTLEALRARDRPVAGLIIGSWPHEPDLNELSNREALLQFGVPLLGAIPAGAGSLEPAAFRAAAPGWLRGLKWPTPTES
ncbi:MAG: dethiobiotin synthase [Solirubrobacterales bacterium]|nr:dethiobiotin synthase [Solirubrobacterales bacterium]